MFFDYRFWHFLTRPFELASQLQTGTMRHFNRRLYLVFLAGIIVFVLREAWGMGTETLTSLMSTMSTTDYIIARYASLAGTLLWSILYIAFHVFGIAWILSILTKIPYRQLVPLQVLIAGVLLMEKAIIFIVFCIARRFSQPFIPIIRSTCRYSYGELVSNLVFEPINNYKRTDHHVAI